VPNHISGEFLTLLCLKARGFLDLRTTLKFTILAAMLKPFNRAKAPIDEAQLSPRERGGFYPTS
jgi:hypothetical protein